MKRILVFVGFLYISFASYSQVRAFLDTNVIGYANQTVLHLQVKTQKNTQVFFPEFKGDTIYDKVEIVQSLPVDTVKTKPFILEKKYIITSFEDSLRNIPTLPVIVRKDTLWSNSLKLFVIPLQMDSSEISKIDTTQIIPVFDIKKPYDVKFTFKEFWLRFGRWIALGILILALIALIVWLIVRYKQNKPLRIIEKPSEPAHIIALRRLEQLKEKKLFQNNKIKEFYSELTDILRLYIEQRFSILALERTSTEIISDFQMYKVLDNSELKKLKSLLNISDLAKFAKFYPSSDVSQNNFDHVKKFVEDTKEEIVSTDIQEENNEEITQKKGIDE